jgi:hypothetical protein
VKAALEQWRWQQQDQEQRYGYHSQGHRNGGGSSAEDGRRPPPPPPPPPPLPPPPPPSAELLAALVGAALWPQVAYVDAPPSTKTGAPCPADAVRLLVRANHDDDGNDDGNTSGGGGSGSGGGGDEAQLPSSACVHPSSVAARLTGEGWVSPFAAFHERVLTTKARKEWFEGRDGGSKWHRYGS